MTIEELRILVEDISNKTNSLTNKSVELRTFLNQVSTIINISNPFSNAINVDAFIAIQNPLYQSKLTEIQTALNELTG